MYHCHTVSDRTVQEGTGDANTSGGGLELIFNLINLTGPYNEYLSVNVNYIVDKLILPQISQYILLDIAC